MTKETKVLWQERKLKIYELPHDILYKICNFSNIIDICYLQNTNKIIKSKLKRISNDILSYQLQLRNNTHYKNKIHFLGEPCLNESKQGTLQNFDSLNQGTLQNFVSLKQGTNSFIINQKTFYDSLNYYLINHLYQYKKIFYRNLQHKELFYKNFKDKNFKQFQFNIINFEKYYDSKYIKQISSHEITNKLFSNIFNFYVLNNFCDIRLYPNKLELLAFYNFLEIETFPNIYFNYFFKFLEQNNNPNIIDLKINYYNSILYKFHYKDNNVPLTFDQQ